MVYLIKTMRIDQKVKSLYVHLYNGVKLGIIINNFFLEGLELYIILILSKVI